MAKEVIRNAAGEPFSKWKPADRFYYVLAKHYPLAAKSCQPEFKFSSDRQWRLDYAWHPERLAVEIDGFGFGHQAQHRISQNNEKRNEAIRLGWQILAFDSRLLGSKAKVEAAAELTWECLCSIRGS